GCEVAGIEIGDRGNESRSGEGQQPRERRAGRPRAAEKCPGAIEDEIRTRGIEENHPRCTRSPAETALTGCFCLGALVVRVLDLLRRAALRCRLVDVFEGRLRVPRTAC